jgi:hypothetical protein
MQNYIDEVKRDRNRYDYEKKKKDYEIFLKHKFKKMKKSQPKKGTKNLDKEDSRSSIAPQQTFGMFKGDVHSHETDSE